MATKVQIDIIANDRASGVASGIAGALGKISAALLVIGTAGVYAFGKLAKEALAATAEYEQLTLSLESLAAREIRAADSTLSMTEALAKAAPATKELLEWTQKLGIESPFDQKGIAQALQMAMNFGFTTDEAKRLTQNLVDLTAATGRSSSEMTNISRALGQVKGRGKLMAGEINQLTEAGVNVGAILEDMGYDLEDVSKGLVSADEFLEAFNKTMEDEVGGAAKRATNSWEGLISTLGDLKDLGLRTLFHDTYEILKPLVAKFAEWLQGDGLVVLEGWSKKLGEITQSLVDMFSTDFDFVGMTQAFEDWVDSIDWKKISQDLAAGIDNIDWAAAGAAAGAAVAEGTQNIVDAITIIFEETDWEAVFSSANNAFLDFMAGLTGQGDWENVKATWASNFDQLNVLTNDVTIRLNAALGNIKWNILHIALSAAFGATNILLIGFFADVMSKISKWKTDIESELIKIKEAFKTQFAQMIQAAISTVIGAGARLLAALQELMALLKGAIKPLSITISLPNPEKLASQVDAILAALAPLGGSQGKQVGANNSFGGGSSGSYSATHAGQSIRATGGNVLAGRPYTVGEQGRELFVPDENGQIVANKNLGGAGGGFVVNLTYSPMFSTVDGYELQERLTPFIERGIRNAQRGTA